MLTGGPVQQGWGPQGPGGPTPGQMTGQGVRPGRMVPGMNAALPTRGGGPPVSRAMLNMQMMGTGERNRPEEEQKRDVLFTFYFNILLLCIRPARDGDE